ELDLRNPADGRLDSDLLFRVGRSQRRLPHGERSVPDGDACNGDSVLLRHRDRDRRNHRTSALRPQYRHRKPYHRLLRLPAWSGPYDPGRTHGDRPRSQRGTTITRRRRRTAHRRIVTTVVRPRETGDTGAGQAGRGDLLSPRPTSATSGCSRLVTAATSSTSTDRATTSCPNPTTTSHDRAGRCAICDQHPKMLKLTILRHQLRPPGPGSPETMAARIAVSASSRLSTIRTHSTFPVPAPVAPAIQRALPPPGHRRACERHSAPRAPRCRR